MNKLLYILNMSFILFLFPASESSAQWVQANGPYGGYVNDFVEIPNPQGGHYIFANASSGIYSSTNSGINWMPLYPKFSQFPIMALTSVGAILFAATNGDGIYRSTDYGVTWLKLSNGVPASIYVNCFYVSSTNLFALTFDGLYLTTDEGISWTKKNSSLPNYQTISMVGHNTNLFVGTWGKGLYKSTDNGESWVNINTLSSKRNFWSLAYNGNDFFAGTDTGVYLSTDNGLNWIYKGLPNSYIYNIIFSGSNIFVGTYRNGIFLSTDYGSTWAPINNGLNYPHILTLTSIDSNLYAGISLRGAYVSTNNGIFWKNITSGISATRITSTISTGTSLFAGGNSLYCLSDNKTDWAYADSGRITNGIISFAYDSSNIIAGTKSNGIYLSTNKGKTWTSNNNGLPNGAVASEITPIYSLAFAGSYIFAGTEVGVYRSSNNGNSWAAANDGLNQYQGPEILSISVIGTDIFAGTRGYGLFHSTDYGYTWTRVETGSPDGIFTALAVSGNNLFAGVDARGLLLSTDGGISWRQQNNGLPNNYIKYITVCDSNLFVSFTGAGVFHSTNMGENWIDVSEGLMNMYVYSLTAHGAYLYAATYGDGVWKRPISEIITSVKEPTKSKVSTSYSLEQNYPNPFNPSTIIKYAVPFESDINIKFYNSLGQIVREVNEGTRQKGYYELNFNSAGLSSGVYFYSIRALSTDGKNDFKASKKMIIIK